MTRRRFTTALFAWLLIGALHALSRYSDMLKYNPNHTFSISDTALYMTSYSLWVVITVVLLHALTRLQFPLKMLHLAGLFFIGLFTWLPLFFVAEFSLSVLVLGGAWDKVLVNLSQLTSTVVFFYAVVYGLTFAACLGIVLTEKTRRTNELNAQLKHRHTQDALTLSNQRMQLMQSQLSPHFLFNCLGAISGLARYSERSLLVEATARVGDLLRFTVSNSTTRLISIDEELHFVEDYIALQKLRFTDRFSYQSKIALPEFGAMCPPFCIQPLIENVFCHAVEQSDGPIDIELVLSFDTKTLNVMLSNSMAPNQASTLSTGTGLSNLRSRLTHLFAENFHLQVTQENARFIVQLSIPLCYEEDKTITESYV